MNQLIARVAMRVPSMANRSVRETFEADATGAGPEKGERTRRQRSRPQSGFLLISALIAITIMTTSLTAGLLGVSAASRVTSRVATEATASSITSSQIDLVRASSYVETGNQYSSVTVPSGYSMSNTTAAITGGNQNIQAVTISVSKNGDVVLETTILRARN